MRFPFLTAVLLSVLPLAAHAGQSIQDTIHIEATGNDETSLFAGLNWTFGSAGAGPTAVLGIIYSEVDAGGDLSGGILSLNVNLSETGGPATMTIAGFTGSETITGQLGLGLNLDGSGLFGLAGFLSNFAQGGLTFDFDGDIGGFLGIHTYEFVEPLMELDLPFGGEGGEFITTPET
ncbi:hypothetical protein HKCCSP123_02225 [Rhodobacterales bacterium HKCCSP123]|nr:hypothetical protein [Rhodobacterales bacterium HKCCSP123]